MGGRGGWGEGEPGLPAPFTARPGSEAPEGEPAGSDFLELTWCPALPANPPVRKDSSPVTQGRTAPGGRGFLAVPWPQYATNRRRIGPSAVKWRGPLELQR